MAGEKELPKPALEGETCIAGRPQTKTEFINYPLKELKQMLEGTNPGAIEETGRHWGTVSEILAGGEGGGIAGLLDKAVDNVLEHWDGEAARAFEKKARGIAQSVRNAAWHADLNSSQMADAAGQLRTYKTQLDAIEEPSGWAKVGDALSDWSWDNGESTAEDLGDRKLTAKEVAEINEGKIGASREAHLNGVAVMENLGAQYMRVERNLTKNKIHHDDQGNIKEPNREVEYPPPVAVGDGSASRPGGSTSGNKPWSAGPPKSIGTAPEVPRPKGITGGVPLPPSTGTNVDSIKPGLTGPGISSGSGGISGGGGNSVGGGAGSGVMVPGGAGNLGAGGARGGISTAGSRGGRLGGPGGAGAAAGRGTGAAAGRSTGARAGMGGMGGGAGAGAAGRGGASAGGRGALAKSRGGVVGAAKGITGKGTGGGAGLHGSRGGTQRGGMMGGMAGGTGGRNGRRSGDENERGERPDYLVEDEETWISEEDRNRNVPRNIE
ncbi:hypothetical protein [Streptomyces sp. Wb2n-11]|uniref:hypothetical protein n=1 Tax=Streptomyces sp. Wb2n-11 TaxID=1030533 RepID=UPI000A7D2F95|nr:hypothetical protein [Streptomyces sp. Wb2n-11]